MESNLKIGSCLLLIAIFGALAMRTGFAQETGTQPRDDSKAGSTQDSADKNSDAVDTHIAPSAWHHVHGHARKSGNSKTGGVGLVITSQHRRTNLVSQPAHQATRNAIGVSVTPQQGSAARHDDTRSLTLERPVSLPTGAVSRAPITAASGTSASGLGQFESRSVRPPPAVHINPVAGSAVGNRGAINGTWAAHHGPAPTSLGGPHTAVAGISGNMVRPKH